MQCALFWLGRLLVEAINASSANVDARAVSSFLAAFLLAAFQQVRPDHPTRVRIYEHLLRLPGDHFRSIVRSLRLGIGTTRHHLDVLEKEGLVHSERRNGRCRYYPRGREVHPQLNWLYDRHWNYRDLRTRVLFTVRRLEDARPVTVARTLRISRQLAAYHLEKLEESGYLRRVGGRYQT